VVVLLQRALYDNDDEVRGTSVDCTLHPSCVFRASLLNLLQLAIRQLVCAVFSFACTRSALATLCPKAVLPTMFAEAWAVIVWWWCVHTALTCRASLMNPFADAYMTVGVHGPF
jgi:hypothetical protein